MRVYNAESPKQDSRRFNSIVKTKYIDNLGIVYLWAHRTVGYWSHQLGGEATATIPAPIRSESKKTPPKKTRVTLNKVTFFFSEVAAQCPASPPPPPGYPSQLTGCPALKNTWKLTFRKNICYWVTMYIIRAERENIFASMYAYTDFRDTLKYEKKIVLRIQNGVVIQ